LSIVSLKTFYELETNIPSMDDNRLSLFKQLMNEEWLKQSPGGRTMLAVLFTNEDFGVNGVAARQSIHISSHTADLAFTYPLGIYDLLTRMGMTDIINAAEKTSDMGDFHRKLTPLSRALVYAHSLAILDFYAFPIDMIPDVNYDVLRKGFGVMYDHTKPVMEVFKPSAQIPSNLTYNLPPASDFHSKDKMAWYLCETDLRWTRLLFEGVKSSTFGLPLSLYHAIVCVTELATQNFFNLYSTGIHALVKNEPLTKEQYIILNMVFKLDLDCYNDFVGYHKEIDVLPDRFFGEMDIFLDNVALMYNKVCNSEVKR